MRCKPVPTMVRVANTNRAKTTTAYTEVEQPSEVERIAVSALCPLCRIRLPNKMAGTEEIDVPLFKPFRALGYITDDVPFAVTRRGKETYVVVSVGKAWQVCVILI